MDTATIEEKDLSGFIIGELVEAATDITTGFMSSKVLCETGIRLKVIGSSGNAIHPIAVSREDDDSWVIAVSSRDIRRI
jgi:hypothetical protein